MEKLIKDFKSLSKFIGIISLYHVCNLVSYLVDLSNVDLSSLVSTPLFSTSASPIRSGRRPYLSPIHIMLLATASHLA